MSKNYYFFIRDISYKKHLQQSVFNQLLITRHMTILNPVEILLLSWFLSALGGITASIYGYFTDPKQIFDKRKFTMALVTGIIAGVVFGITNASVNPVFKDPKASMIDVAYQLGLTFIGALGIDFLRNRTGDVVKAASPSPDNSGSNPPT